MRRRREVASAPRRTAGETWQTIADLVGGTLERSSGIDRAAVDQAMTVAGGAGRMLVGGGHLESDPLVVVAGDLYLEIVTVSGDKSLSFDENLNPVPGAASAQSWKIHLSADGPLAKVVKAAAKLDDHLTVDEPDSASIGEAAKSSDDLVDHAALAQWAEERQ